MAKNNSFFMLKKSRVLKGVPETLDDVTLREFQWRHGKMKKCLPTN